VCLLRHPSLATITVTLSCILFWADICTVSRDGANEKIVDDGWLPPPPEPWERYALTHVHTQNEIHKSQFLKCDKLEYFIRLPGYLSPMMM
jgi:hypothetical protein